MADGVQVTAGTGTTVATDQLATGEHVQFVKLMDGTLDGTEKIAGDAANGLDVDVTRVSGTVTTTISGTVSVNPVGETAGVGVGAAADSSAVNSVIGLLKKLIGLFPAALGAGGGLKVDGSGTALPVSGTVTANAGTGPFPVSDNAGSLTVDNAGTFAVQDSQVIADNAAFTDGTSKVLMAGFAFDDVAGTALTENDAAAARIDSKRAQIGVIEDATTRGQKAAVSAAGRLSVDASGVAVPVTDNSGSLTVDAPVGTPVFVRLSDGAAAITALPVTDNAGSLTVDNAGTFAVQDSEKIADNAGFTDGTTKVQPAGFIFDEVAGTALTENDIGAARMNANRATVSTIEDGATRARYATVTASNALKTDGSAVTQPVSVASTLSVEQVPGTTGGYTISRTLAAASTNSTNVKASAGKVFGWYLANAAAYTVFLKLYNKATAPTVGTDTPVITIPIPAGSAANVEFQGGIAFATGIGFGITKLVADADTTAVVANDLVVNLFYK